MSSQHDFDVNSPVVNNVMLRRRQIVLLNVVTAR